MGGEGSAARNGSTWLILFGRETRGKLSQMNSMKISERPFYLLPAGFSALPDQPFGFEASQRDQAERDIVCNRFH